MRIIYVIKSSDSLSMFGLFVWSCMVLSSSSIYISYLTYYLMLLKFETPNKQALVNIKIKKQKMDFVFRWTHISLNITLNSKQCLIFMNTEDFLKRKIVWNFLKHFKANIFQVLKKDSLKKLNLLLKQVQNCNHI